MKSLHTNKSFTNLLDKSEFKAAIRFEARYASVIKGGYLPANLSYRQETRLISTINLLSSEEQKELINKFPLFSN
jgi:hypothetical protein